MRLEIKSVEAFQFDLILCSEKAVSFDAHGFLVGVDYVDLINIKTE